MYNTSMPEHLISITGQALRVMRANERHELPPIYRFVIYSELDGVGDDVRTVPNIGQSTRHTRFLLDIATVQRILPIWQADMPDDPWPHNLIKTAEAVINGNMSSDEACFLAREAELELLAYEESARLREQSRFAKATSGAMWVCDAALVLALEACGIFMFDAESPDEHETDADIDPSTSDVAKFAACAYGGAPWIRSEDNPTKRKEFWEWWLLEAIPEAWQMAYEHSC